MATRTRTTLRLVEPSSALDIVDDIDEARQLVAVACMATAELPADQRSPLCALLDVIERKLKALSSSVAPNGIVRA